MYFKRILEKHLKLTNPTVTGIIKRLEEKNMIVRSPSAEDARYKCLHVTEEGHDTVHKCFHEGILSIESRLIKGMSKEEETQFRELLYKALKIWRNSPPYFYDIYIACYVN